MTRLTGEQIADAGLTGWAYLVRGLQTRIGTGDFATGLRVVDAIGAAAEEANHHPDVDLRYPHVDVTLTSHDEDGVTERDVELARRISAIATEAGVGLDATVTTRVEWGLDSPDGRAVTPFWAAVLAMENPTDAPDDVVDPAGVLPLIWIQGSGDEPDRQRWHPDLWIPRNQVEGRIEAAVAAGGTLVSDAAAPSFWVLADAQGNQVCLCTTAERD